MAINVTTLADECAAQGADWEEVLEQRARENAKMKELGLQPPVDKKAGGDKRGNDNQDDEGGKGDGQKNRKR
jgi:capsid protein